MAIDNGGKKFDCLAEADSGGKKDIFSAVIDELERDVALVCLEDTNEVRSSYQEDCRP
jgi:hypothetical protein